MNFIKKYLKQKLAGDELKELQILKLRINDLKVWCSANNDVSAAAEWLENPTSYPLQYKGCHGSIVDIREYLRKLDEEGDY